MPNVTELFPVFAVRDLQEAIDYYRDQLGFTVAWTWGEPVKNPRFFEVSIGTWKRKPKSKLQDFDFEEKRKRRLTFFTRSRNPGRAF